MRHKYVKLYRLDGRLVTWRELIQAADDVGYSPDDGIARTEEAAHFLRLHGHAVIEQAPVQTRVE